MKKPKRKRILIILLSIIVLGFLLPQKIIIPVKGASDSDWNKDSFWYYPWGESVTHKGIDIFAERRTPVVSATSGIVIYTGSLGRGGKIVVVLGSKWRLHYYAHLDTIDCNKLSFRRKGTNLGTVGNTGNAENTPAHLHYSIITTFPYPWRADNSPQGWKKMFFLNPDQLLKQ